MATNLLVITSKHFASKVLNTPLKKFNTFVALAVLQVIILFLSTLTIKVISMDSK